MEDVFKRMMKSFGTKEGGDDQEKNVDSTGVFIGEYSDNGTEAGGDMLPPLPSEEGDGPADRILGGQTEERREAA